MQNTFKYVEEFNADGILIGIKEVKSTDKPFELQQKIQKNREKIERKAIEEAQFQEKLKLEEKESNEIVARKKKYSLSRFLLAYNYCLLMGQVDTVDQLNKIMAEKDLLARSNLIESTLQLYEFTSVKKLFDLLAEEDL